MTTLARVLRHTSARHVRGRAVGPAPSGVLASPTFSAGWATFGLPLAQGELPSGQSLKVGTLDTQTDVKTTWGDGSARFCVVTCKPTGSGALDIAAGSAASGSWTPAAPTAGVVLTVSGTAYTATLPSGAGTDLWLDGALCKEWRRVVTPVTGGSTPHPTLRVIFDVRRYSDGQGRLTVCVENCLDVTDATVVTYDVAVTVDGSTVFTKAAVAHWYTTRWAEKYALDSLSESSVAHDMEPFHRARALPRYAAALVSDDSYTFTGTRWDILQRGGLSNNQMNQAAARAELGFFPDWVAQYIVHRGATQYEWLVRTAYRAGSNPVHLRETDGRYILITSRPTFWHDYNGMSSGDPADRPKGNLNNDSVNDYSGGNPFIPDRAHQPSFVYPGYLLTGDRFLHDEMVFWSMWDTANIPPSWRGDTEGRQVGDSARGTAWPLRSLAECAAFAADAETVRPFLRAAVGYSLAWYDSYAAGGQNFPYTGKPVQNALGTSFEIQDSSGFLAYVGTVYLSVWQQSFVCYAIQRTNDLGFTGGLDLLDRMATFACLLLDSAPGWPQDEGVPYYPMVGTYSGTYPTFTWSMEATAADAYALNASRAAGGSQQQGEMGWPWNTAARVFYTQIEAPAVRLANRRSLPHSAAAVAVVDAYLASNPSSVQAAYALQEPWYG